MSRTTLARSLVLLVAGALAAAGLVAPADAQRATEPTRFYLAMGDSLAAGYQPGAGNDKQGGYVGRVLTELRATYPRTVLRNVSCSGETSTTLVQGGRCTYADGDQLHRALKFLRRHGRVRLVTLTIGANDVTRCLQATDAQACVVERLGQLQTNLDTTLRKIRFVEPRTRIVVTTYYNPFLWAWFEDPVLSQQTALLQGLLNATIGSAAGRHGARVADVAGRFSSADTAMTQLGPTAMPTNVAVVCQYTWMCRSNDIHANDGGYALIADAVTDVL